MVERVSALQGHLAPRRIGRIDGEPGVRLTERRLASLWQVAAWPGRLPLAGAAIARAAVVDAAPGPGRSVEGPGGTLLRHEVMKCLLASPVPVPRPEVPGDVGTVLDLSHARTVIHVAGPAMRALMAGMTSVDLRPAAFADGAVAGTGIHHVGVLLHGRGGGVDLYVPRSFGLAIWEHLIESGAQYGVEIG